MTTNDTTPTQLTVTIANSCGGGETRQFTGDSETALAIAKTWLEEKQVTVDSSAVQQNIRSRETVAIAQIRLRQRLATVAIGAVVIVFLLAMFSPRRQANDQSFCTGTSGRCGASGDGSSDRRSHGMAS